MASAERIEAYAQAIYAIVEAEGYLSDTEEELLVGEIDPEAARQTRVRRSPGEHEWDTMADRRPGLYRRLLEPAANRDRPPTANLYSGDVE